MDELTKLKQFADNCTIFQTSFSISDGFSLEKDHLAEVIKRTSRKKMKIGSNKKNTSQLLFVKRICVIHKVFFSVSKATWSSFLMKTPFSERQNKIRLYWSISQGKLILTSLASLSVLPCYEVYNGLKDEKKKPEMKYKWNERKIRKIKPADCDIVAHQSFVSLFRIQVTCVLLS